jgi:hypothetical protein
LESDYLKDQDYDGMKTYSREMILDAERRVELAKDRAQWQILLLALLKLLVLLPGYYLRERG